jgi:hypothetical protein
VKLGHHGLGNKQCKEKGEKFCFHDLIFFV